MATIPGAELLAGHEVEDAAVEAGVAAAIDDQLVSRWRVRKAAHIAVGEQHAIGLATGTPLPMRTMQIAGVQVCAFPPQVHLRAGTRPPPLHSGHRSVRFMIAPMRVVSHLVGFTRQAPVTARSGSRQGLAIGGVCPSLTLADR